MALDFNDRMKLLFGPWAAAAGRPDLTGQLKTGPLPKARKQSQFERLKELPKPFNELLKPFRELLE